MLHSKQWLVVVPIIVGLQLSACVKQAETTSKKIEPATVEPAQEGRELSRLILTPKAAERLGIQTAPVREAQVASKPATTASADPASPGNPGSPAPVSVDAGGTTQKVVPYSALLYDIHGKTWVYKSPEPLTFVRHQVEVDYIEGDAVVLSDGPPAGTGVVTVGAAELYGTEFKVGH
jgi:hypothetical protein